MSFFEKYGDTNLNREAGLCAVAAMFAINPVTERADGRRVRGESQVVVCPLAEDCNQVSVEGVAVHILVSRC